MAVQESSGVVMHDLRDESSYRGYVNGDTNQIATFIIRKNTFSGYFLLQDTLWTIAQIGKVSTGLQGDLSTTYIKYKDKIIPSIKCGTASNNVSSDTEEDEVDLRGVGMRFLELAFEIDGETYTELGSEAAVQDYVVDLVAAEEIRFNAVFRMLFLRAVHINVWQNGTTDPYTGSMENRWLQLKNWWENSANGKDCVQRDAVEMASVASNRNGFVDDAGFASICGYRGGFCGNHPFSVYRFTGDIERDANTASHELGHNFGLAHECLCGLMFAVAACETGGPVVLPIPTCTKFDNSRFSSRSRTRIASYFAGTFTTCKSNSSGQTASDACMVDAPPVTIGFDVNLSANDVILGPNSVICSGQSFEVTFYNTYDSNSSLSWALGPYLAFDDNGPANSKQRKIKLPATASICAPFDSYIEVSFTYNCGPLTYRIPIRLGSSFGLDGEYTSSSGVTNQLGSYNSVQAGSYDLRLENLAATYSWTQTIGTTTTTLSTTSGYFSFGITSGQSISFTASTTGECCTFQRTFAFSTSGGHYLVAPGHNHGITAHQVYPNPATNVITVLFNQSNPPGIKTVELLDLFGRIVKRQTDLTAERCEIQVGDLPAGAYWIRIQDGLQVQTGNVQKL